MRWYNVDAHTWEHRDRAIAAGHPAAIRWEAMPVAERWSLPAQEMLAMSLHHERGAMVLDDLRALPAAPLIIAEGTPVAPSIVEAGERAVWLLPSPEVQRRHLAERNLSPGVLKLYEVLVREIEKEVVAYGAQRVIVDGQRSVEETVAEVERLLSPAVDEGPTARSVTERRELLQYANRAIVAQHQAGLARPWSSGGARTIVREFACECGREGCEELVELAIADFPDPPEAMPTPVLARGHRHVCG